jgi:hypothetical protein
MGELVIVGYEQECNCEHCGRALVHGVKLADGRIVGATCLDKKLSLPRVRDGKSYRYGSEYIVKVAKVVHFKSADKWAAYGVNKQSTVFQAA